MEGQAYPNSGHVRRGKVIPAVLGLGLIAALIAGIAGTVLRPAMAAAGAGAVVNWNAIALRASVTVAHQSSPQSQMYLARVQAAVYDAVVAIEGRYQRSLGQDVFGKIQCRIGSI